MKPPAFVDHCTELLSPLGRVTARRMFGGWGFYADGIIVALIVHDRLHLKTDDATRPRFTAAGCEPFVHTAPGRPVTTSYWTAPGPALDSPDAMAPWARLALEAALRARPAAKATAATAPARPSRPAPATRAAATPASPASPSRRRRDR